MTALWVPPMPMVITPPKWLSAFATAGKGVLTASGKRGLLASGKRALFDASGKCSTCCGQCVCPHLMTPAREYQVTLAGFDAASCAACLVCGTGRNDSVKNTDLKVDGTYNVPYKNSSFSRSFYELFLGADGSFVGYFQEPDCTGSSTVNGIGTTVSVVCDASTETLDVQVSAFWQLFSCNTNPILFLKTGVPCLNYGDDPVVLSDPNQICGAFRNVLSGAEALQVSSAGTVTLEVV